MAIKMVFRRALDEARMQQVRDLGVEACVAPSGAEALEQIGDADAYYGQMTPALLAAAKQLRWVQATSAGLDNFFFPELREHSVVVTNLRGIYSDVIADHVFAFVLSFARGMHHYARRQAEGRWDRRGTEVIHLWGTTLGVIGLGGIGLAVAERGHTFGMRVLAVDPAPKGTPAYVERIYAPAQLHEMLSQVDFLAVCVPHTGETEYMIDASALRGMKQTAILVNIGRGKVVDLAALTAALKAGELGGAGLDVFEVEPLPEGHALWEMAHVIITPHVAGVSPEIKARQMDLIVENVRRFCSGAPLLNVVDKVVGYVVAPNV